VASINRASAYQRHRVISEKALQWQNGGGENNGKRASSGA